LKTRAALTARCGETARRGLVAFLEYGSALEWLIGAGKRDPLAQAAQRLGSPRWEAQRGAGDRNGSKWFDTNLGDPCDGPLTEGAALTFPRINSGTCNCARPAHLVWSAVTSRLRP
jgi:hypothetical protein